MGTMQTLPIPAMPRLSSSIIGIKIIGANGAVFDLVNGTEGAFLTDGLEGVDLPVFKFIERKTARAPGRRVLGINWDTGRCSLKITVGDTWANRPTGNFRAGRDWLQLDRTFRGAFTPLGITVVEVTTPDGVRRFRGRLEPDGFEADTGKAATLADINGLASYSIELGADWPFWQGIPVDYDFPYASVQGDNYYGPANAAPDFIISKGNSLARAVVLNPGQVEAWPEWIITGPAQATVGVSDHLTRVNGLSSGQQIRITTNPSSMDVRDESGTRAWGAIAEYDFAGIAPGESSNISAQIVGGGDGANIHLTLTPNYLSWY
jgi:hypothetical protein